MASIPTASIPFTTIYKIAIKLAKHSFNTAYTPTLVTHTHTHTQTHYPENGNPLDQIYCSSRSGTVDLFQIVQVLQTTLSHLDSNIVCEIAVHWLQLSFQHYSSHILSSKLQDLGLITSLCNWVLDFLTGTTDGVGGLQHTHTQHRSPQGCVLSPLLYSLYISDWQHTTNSIVKFADDTVVVGLISHNDERAYVDQVDSLLLWCR
ncbi:hypothetical protein LDENG_00215980 [Lucifuga dentata]|nr:hypothetical protein LDENG_00215980 [Lucifuga dentata]